jgi:hypothetical protein
MVLFLAAGAVHVLADPAVDPLTAMDPSSLVLCLLKSLAGWLWVMAIIGAARAWFAHRGSPAPAPAAPGRPALLARLGPYANEAVLPSTCSTRPSSSWSPTSSSPGRSAAPPSTA